MNILDLTLNKFNDSYLGIATVSINNFYFFNKILF